MSESKEGIRKRLRASRKGLTRTQAEVKSQQILQLVQTALPWSTINTLHIFLPITRENEPDTFLILDYLWTKFPSIKTYTSVVMTQSGDMLIVPITRDTPLATNKMGIPEPLGEHPVDPGPLDAIIVPVVGFDESGNRLGFGAGYYDHFLVNHPQAQKIGLAYEISKTDNTNPSGHDVPLDMVITEQQIYRIN